MAHKMLEQMLVDRGCDAILVMDIKDIRYLCGFSADNAVMLYMHEGMVLITAPKFEPEAKMNAKNVRLVLNEKELTLWDLPELYKELKIKRMGFSASEVTVALYNKIKNIVEMVPLDIIPTAYRRIKTKEEINLIRKSVSITEKAYKEALPKLFDGVTEKEFAAEISYRMKLNGADLIWPSSEFTVVAFAENSAVVGVQTGDKKIIGDGSLIVDFGTSYKGYCCDETVTLLFGKVDERILDIYDAVYTAQKMAIEAVKPGLTAAELYNKAYGYLKDKGYGKYIQHTLGHHIGLSVHEYPKITSFADLIFEEGMVFTVEPGLYIPGVGGVRLEDTVTVTSKGVEVLTSLSKEKKILN